MTLGLALGAGGARGFCHVGALQELNRAGIRPQVVAGASIGALVGAAYAAGTVDRLADWASDLTLARYVSLLDLRPVRGGVIGGQVIETLFDLLDLPDRIEDLPMPFACTACDVDTGEEHWFRDGPLFDAVRASMALPGVLAPWHTQAGWMIDGGIVNPVPLDLAAELGAGRVIAITPAVRGPGAVTGAPAAPRPPALATVMVNSFEIMVERMRRDAMAAHPPAVSLDAGLLDMTAMDFHRAPKAMEAGRRVVLDALPDIRAALA